MGDEVELDRKPNAAADPHRIVSARSAKSVAARQRRGTRATSRSARCGCRMPRLHVASDIFLGGRGPLQTKNVAYCTVSSTSANVPSRVRIEPRNPCMAPPLPRFVSCHSLESAEPSQRPDTEVHATLTESPWGPSVLPGCASCICGPSCASRSPTSPPSGPRHP